MVFVSLFPRLMRQRQQLQYCRSRGNDWFPSHSVQKGPPGECFMLRSRSIPVIGLRLTMIPAIPRARYSIRESSPKLDFGNLLFLFIARNYAAFVLTWSGNGVRPAPLTAGSRDQRPQTFRTSA